MIITIRYNIVLSNVPGFVAVWFQEKRGNKIDCLFLNPYDDFGQVNVKVREELEQQHHGKIHILSVLLVPCSISVVNETETSSLA